MYLDFFELSWMARILLLLQSINASILLLSLYLTEPSTNFQLPLYPFFNHCQHYIAIKSSLQIFLFVFNFCFNSFRDFRHSFQLVSSPKIRSKHACPCFTSWHSSSHYLTDSSQIISLKPNPTEAALSTTFSHLLVILPSNSSPNTNSWCRSPIVLKKWSTRWPSMAW